MIGVPGFYKALPIVPRFNIAPSQPAPVIIASEKGRQLEMFRWGLVPSWSKSETTSYSLINARADTIQEKPSYKRPFQKTRCLVLADGFFEWQNPGTKKKIPFRVTLKSRKPFAIAGIWDAWKKPDGTELRSFALITTDAAKSLLYIHDRMPVILDPKEYDAWLDAKTDTKELLPMLNPLEDEKINAYQISDMVNKPENDKPEIIRPIQKLMTEEEHF